MVQTTDNQFVKYIFNNPIACTSERSMSLCQRVAIVVFHLFTLCIPLIWYSCRAHPSIDTPLKTLVFPSQTIAGFCLEPAYAVYANKVGEMGLQAGGELAARIQQSLSDGGTYFMLRRAGLAARRFLLEEILLPVRQLQAKNQEESIAICFIEALFAFCNLFVEASFYSEMSKSKWLDKICALLEQVPGYAIHLTAMADQVPTMKGVKAFQEAFQLLRNREEPSLDIAYLKRKNTKEARIILRALGH